MITILCSGSRGDIQPYIALAVQLKEQGKDVRIAAGKSFGEFIESYGVKHLPLTADYKSTNIDPKLLESAQNSTNPIKMLLTFKKMKKYSRMMVDEMYEACIGSDVVVYHPGCTIGYFAAQQMGIPSVLASPFPMLKTSKTPSIIAYGKTKMPVNLSYKMLQSMLWMASKTGIIEFWKEKFGKLPENFGCPFERIDEQHPSIVSCSRYVFPKPNDWNKNVYQFGYWFTEEKTEYTPPKELLDFLSEGEKPIYFGFGSVFNYKDKFEFLNYVKEALEATGKRGIICGMGEFNCLPENIFAIDSVPHTWLFPRCSAVCHHGGAGTTAAGFAAGIPSIIIPFSNDQFAWAHRSFDIGVGAKPIYKSQLSSQKLVESINYVFSDKVIENAKQLGRNIASEHGAKYSANIISRLIK